MLLIPERERTAIQRRRILRWTAGLLFFAGSISLLYVAFTLIRARIYQQVANRALEQQIRAKDRHRADLPRTPEKEGDVLGRIEIPRLGIAVAILEGTASQTLRLGVGHIGGTAIPGESGNTGIAGHRDTFFRGLKDIRKNDEIQIQTEAGLSRYAVDWVKIVAPDDVAVLAPSAESAITLVTCYPFYYVGPAPRRFIVHARKI
jgi:sortase A